jgi:dTDP-4-dehydrorhamnose reductase
LFQDVFYTPILVETATRAIHDLIDCGATGIFNVVGGERISKAEFGFKVAKVFNLDSSLIHSGFQRDKLSLVPRPGDMSLSNKKLCKMLGREFSSVTDQLSRLQLQEQDGVARELNGV